MAAYLYRTALRSPDYGRVQRVIRILDGLGWTEWDGFVVQWARKNSGGPAQWEVIGLLEQLPLPSGRRRPSSGSWTGWRGRKS